MQERDIFIEALEKPSPEERDAYLASACGDDAALRDRVEHLLLEHEREASFILDTPAHGSALTLDAPTLHIPVDTIIGHYKLLEQIGEGGMGTVWIAEQKQPIHRRVALKVIKAGMDTRQVIARFEAERQALALMDHPNIAKVFDAGMTDTGRPYFVMELVKGMPITRYCDKHRIEPRQRLELFMQVCQAVQHAHQKGVIHRDLKPSNVLVAQYDGKPVVKVIDFGVAKATGQLLTDLTMLTGLGNIVGTLEYMSPEQAEMNQLDIDTRSDIYSLGVLLYELLAGCTPFTKKDLEKAGMVEMLRVIREVEPSKPSTKLSTAEGLPTLAANRGTEPAKLTRLVRGELDWIVMKALEKDRTRRYETANGLAMDIQRFLADEQVLACPPSVSYRLRKFARRNKGGLAVAALVLFFLVLLGSGIGWAWRDRSARETEAAQKQAAQQGKVAAQVGSILNEVDRLEQEQKWPEALATARRAEAAAAGGEADATTTGRVRQRLKELEFIDRLEQIRLEHTAKTDQEYGRAFRDYGVDIEELAVETSIERLKIRPALAIALAATLDDWVSLRNPGTPQIEVAGWKRLVAIAGGIDPEPLRDLLRSTWGRPRSETQDELRRLADSINIRAQHPVTLSQLGLTLSNAGLRDLAVRILREAQLVYPGDHRLNYLLAIHVDGAEKVRFYTAALAARPNSLSLYVTLGQGLEQIGKLDEAAAVYRRLIEIDPKGHFGNQGYYGVAYVLLHQAKPDEAIAVYRKAIAAVPETDYEISYLIRIGEILECQKKFDEVIAVYRRVIELNPKSQLEGFASYHIGNALRAQKKLDAAIDAYRKAVELFPTNYEINIDLGHALRSRGKPDEAIAAYRKAIDVLTALARNSTQQRYLAATIARAQYDLGVILCDDLRDFENATVCFRKVIELQPHTQAYISLGNALRGEKKPEEAIAAYKKAIELDPKNAQAYGGLGVALFDQQKLDDAIAALHKSIKLNPAYAQAYANLAAALGSQRKLDDALAASRKAIELDPTNAIARNNLGVGLNALAWDLATHPDAARRDPGRAVSLAREAVELKPQEGQYWNTLGAAQYRAGDWKASITAFDKSMQLRKSGDSSDWFFLAMAHWQLGENDKAREWYDRAVKWMDKNQPKDEALRRFHAEAAELLELKEKKN